ncbi:hypothetical protein HLB30_07400 [Peptostreptococcus russellii]|uniref:ORF6C domain-containing protein n=1 Tax=Peptostreptococcus russellii TaxID=215200 RepID=UPI0016246E12|nr:ORF6C domain-containing protein [Peptostreptococcus russellii]MBC2578339.1 hypothetical protein [Peptostreptococcus russellii]
MNEVMNFRNDQFGEIRTVLISEEPYFMLSDVCRVLEIKNSRDAKSRLNRGGVGTTDIIDSLGRKQQADFINESNLYKLIFQSRKPQAEKFTEWVTSEVLPSIRKQGFYERETLSRELRAIIWLDKQQQNINKKLDNIDISIIEFKENIPLFAIECENLNKAIKKKATDSLGGYKSNAYNDKSLRGKVYADIHGEIRRQFCVNSYKGIKRTQYDRALEIVRNYKLPIMLSEDIQDALNQ